MYTRPVSSQPLSTTEAIIIDGANGITHGPREGFPDSGWSLGLFALTVLVGAMVARKAPRWLLALLVLPAAPGLWHLLAVRADAPLNRGQTAAAISSSVQALQTVAPRTSPVHFLREDDGHTFPLTRYAVPSRPRTGPEAVQLDVRDAPLPLKCERTDNSVHCGAAQ